jgi:8-oxo-dGTP pyrophosphatase MutT (NUDIX family)
MGPDPVASDPPVPDPLVTVLDGYQPRTRGEADDLERVMERVATGQPWDRSTPLHVTASAMIVHPASEHVLLRWHARQRDWLQVGGHGDPGEVDPFAIALREAREETGLDDLVGWPDGRIVHVAIVPVPAATHEPAHEHADVRFVMATEQPDRARPENPTAALRWMTIPDAMTTTANANVRETLARVEHLLRGSSWLV